MASLEAWREGGDIISRMFTYDLHEALQLVFLRWCRKLTDFS